MYSRVVVCLLSASVYFAEAYPITYPLENEEYIPEEIPYAKPSLEYDNTDPGGYSYHFSLMREISDFWDTGEFFFTYPSRDGTIGSDVGYCPHYTGYSQNLMIMFGATALLPPSYWNCTAKEIYFTTADFVGTAGNERICGVGNCCEPMLGQPKFSDDQLAWQDWLDNLISSGSCQAEVMTEELYCVMIDGHWRINCMERFVTATERNIVTPCYDYHVKYWLSCPIFKTVAVDLGLDWEPASYDDVLTLEQRTVVECITLNVDQMCHPYSYYFPSTGQTSTSEGDDASYGTIAKAFTAFFFMLF